MRARIQRSSTDDGRASGSTAPDSSRSRLAFQSLLASLRPSSIVPHEKRGSWPVVILRSPYRVASAPYGSSASSGSMPVPSVRDMRFPSGFCRYEWMTASRNGSSPISSRPEKIIRATQRKMMSRAVVSTLPG
jgi:hypothetical protein